MSDPIPAEIPLPNAPLERVIAQVRFSSILKIEQREFITSFQDGIRTRYPSLEHDRTHLLAVGPDGLVPKEVGTRWRFVDQSGEWTVSLTPDFVALETTRYTSRADFFSRFGAVVEQVHTHFKPGLVERIGVRYIDRIDHDGLAEISNLVRGELSGVLQSPFRAAAVHALSEHIFEIDSARLLARWGILRANRTVDPAAIEPIEQPSWLLDLDMFRVGKQPFVPRAIVAEARGYAERIYCFFRWAVTPAFLTRYGGAV
ncbi:MAG: TIGR04255 family protein [Myxococcales bacterium]|nr:TIGR04255 family protein [Myxococcales bacterium]